MNRIGLFFSSLFVLIALGSSTLFVVDQRLYQAALDRALAELARAQAESRLAGAQEPTRDLDPILARAEADYGIGIVETEFDGDLDAVAAALRAEMAACALACSVMEKAS